MSTKPDPDSDKQTVLLYDISPQLEKELLRRANENGTNLETEASVIIERHVKQSSPAKDAD